MLTRGNYMKQIIKFIALALSVLAVILTAGCNESYQDAIIYFEIPERPFSLDPQTVFSDSELAVVGNIFEGLLRKNDGGAIAGGMAESFSKDGLTYTFKIRSDAKWSNETPVTSNDFLFAFKRALLPETEAPFASRLFSIENAEQINSGKLSADSLGVSVPDDKTLIIRLCRDDKNFESALTTSVAMPCNEEFFNASAGKYGLTEETVISCGSYTLSKWKKDPFSFKLKRNPLYNGPFAAKNSAVHITKSEEETAIQRLKDNNVDIAFIDSSLSVSAKESGLKTSEYSNICWFLTMNSELKPNFRKSFAMLIGENVFKNDLMPGYSYSGSVFPPAVLKNADSSGVLGYDLNAAKELFSKETNTLDEKKFPSDIKLYYYDNGAIKPIITDIVGHWQNNLGAFINIEAVDSADKLIPELKNPALTMAVFPVRAESNDINEYLKNFPTVSGKTASEIQAALLKSNNIVPLLYQNTTIAYSPALNDVFTTLGNGYIDFSFIVKTES